MSMEESKSSLRIALSEVSLTDGCRIIVFSIPERAIFNPLSFKRSFSAICINNNLFFISGGRLASTVYGVWIGGTPASWMIISLLNYTFASYSYLFSENTP